MFFYFLNYCLLITVIELLCQDTYVHLLAHGNEKQ